MGIPWETLTDVARQLTQSAAVLSAARPSRHDRTGLTERPMELGRTFGLPRSLPLGPQNHELLVADGIGHGRVDRGNPRAGWHLGAPREKGLN